MVGILCQPRWAKTQEKIDADDVYQNAAHFNHGKFYWPSILPKFGKGNG